MKKIILCLALLMLAAVACTPVCQIKDTRCNGTAAEVCDSNGRWQLVMNCPDIKGQAGVNWTCCATRDAAGNEIHACLPEAECNGGGK